MKIKINCAGRLELCAVPDTWTRILYLKVYTEEYECKVLMHYKTHISSSKSDYATACHKNASDQVYVTGLRDLFMSPCVCVCITSLKKVDIFKCKPLYRIKLDTTIYILTETGWQKLRPLTEL